MSGDLHRQLQDLRSQLAEQNEIVLQADAALATFRAGRGRIRAQIIATLRTVFRDGQMGVAGFTGARAVVDSGVWVGPAEDRIDPETGEFTPRGHVEPVERLVILRDPDAIKKRRELFGELDDLFECHAPHRVTYDLAVAERDATLRAMNQVQELIAHPPKPPRNATPDLFGGDR
jgi:hypothetical protein